MLCMHSEYHIFYLSCGNISFTLTSSSKIPKIYFFDSTWLMHFFIDFFWCFDIVDFSAMQLRCITYQHTRLPSANAVLFRSRTETWNVLVLFIVKKLFPHSSVHTWDSCFVFDRNWIFCIYLLPLQSTM